MLLVRIVFIISFLIRMSPVDGAKKCKASEVRRQGVKRKAEPEGINVFVPVNLMKCGDRELVYREAVRWAEKNQELVSGLGLREIFGCGFWLREAIENGLEMPFGALC